MTNYRYMPSFRDKRGNFAQRQPQLLVVGALAGGFLLGYWLNNARHGSDQWLRMEADPNGDRRSTNWPEGEQNNAGSSLPSARLGATEDQIKPSMQQSAANAVPRDEVGTTGTAYDLDPNSITGG
ncbi:MAG: hypothetical protein U0350_37730 [Caldilineaceae bacterium]